MSVFAVQRDAPRDSASPSALGAGVLCGDFARGQRDVVPSRASQPCDFATGMRARDIAFVTGDFATGVRLTPRSRVTADFATGRRRGETGTGLELPKTASAFCARFYPAAELSRRP